MSWYKAYAADREAVWGSPADLARDGALLSSHSEHGEGGSGPTASSRPGHSGISDPHPSKHARVVPSHPPASPTAPASRHGARAPHPPPLSHEIEPEEEPLLQQPSTPTKASARASSPAARLDLLSVWGQTWGGRNAKQPGQPSRKLVPGGNVDFIITKWNAAWDGAPTNSRKQQPQQPATFAGAAGAPSSGKGPAASNISRSPSTAAQYIQCPNSPPNNLRLRKPISSMPNLACAVAVAGHSNNNNNSSSSSSSPRAAPYSSGRSVSPTGRRSPPAALNILHPGSPSRSNSSSSQGLLATAAAAAAATAALTQRPWWRSHWWLAGGLGLALTSASAVGAAYLVLAYLLKVVSAGTIAWKAATAVAAAEGLCLGSWSCGLAADKEVATGVLAAAQQQHVRDVAALQALLRSEEARRTEAVHGLLQLQQALLLKLDALNTSVAGPCIHASSMASAASVGVAALGSGQAQVADQVAAVAASQQQLLTMMCDVKEELLSLQACPIPHVVTTPRASDAPVAAAGHPPPAEHQHKVQARQQAASCGPAAAAAAAQHDVLRPAACTVEHVVLRPGPGQSAEAVEWVGAGQEGASAEVVVVAAPDMEAYSTACSLRRRNIRQGVDSAVDAAVQQMFD